MKKVSSAKIFLLLTVMICILLLGMVSCGEARDEVPEKTAYNIVKDYGFRDDADLMWYRAVDTNSPEIVTELSVGVVKCRVVSLEDIDYDVTRHTAPHFEYTVEIAEVLLDVKGALHVGDSVCVRSTEGVMTVPEIVEVIGQKAKYKKLGLPEGEYGENDYIRSSIYDAVPMRVGHTYILFLSDKFLEDKGYYTEAGQSCLYEYTEDGSVYVTRDRVLYENGDLSCLTEQLAAQIARRTGRADEIGADAYMAELAAARQAERDGTT